MNTEPMLILADGNNLAWAGYHAHCTRWEQASSVRTPPAASLGPHTAGLKQTCML